MINSIATNNKLKSLAEEANIIPDNANRMNARYSDTPPFKREAKSTAKISTKIAANRKKRLKNRANASSR